MGIRSCDAIHEFLRMIHSFVNVTMRIQIHIPFPAIGVDIGTGSYMLFLLELSRSFRLFCFLDKSSADNFRNVLCGSFRESTIHRLLVLFRISDVRFYTRRFLRSHLDHLSDLLPQNGYLEQPCKLLGKRKIDPQPFPSILFAHQ